MLAPTIDFLPDIEPGDVTLPSLHGHGYDLPLKSVRYEARLTSVAASVKMVQTFTNHHPHPVEAVYTFPLSGNSAVHKMVIKVAGRTLVGQVQERITARRAYEQGMNRGQRSVLVEQQRENVFTAKVGNVNAGETVTIELDYAEKLETRYGQTEFRLPTTVSARYFPPGANRRFHHPIASNQVRLEAEIVFDGLPAEVCSSQHALAARVDQGNLVLHLASKHERMDRDLVVRYHHQSEQLKARLVEHDGHFVLDIEAPSQACETTVGKDVVILFDRSGSMNGWKMESCRRAVIDYLQRLQPRDRFLLVAFDDRLEYFSDDFQPAWVTGKAESWVQSIRSRGGTDIRTPLEKAVQLPFDDDRQAVVVLMTDGQVGNEHSIYQVAKRSLGKIRVFTLGIGSAVNDAFLRRMAAQGRGSCELVTSGERLEQGVKRLADETGIPVLLDLWLEGPVSELAPDRLPDLYAGRPVSVFGKLQSEGPVTVRAKLAGSQALWSCELLPQASRNSAIAKLWARQKVRQIEDDLLLAAVNEREICEREITELALEHGLLTRFTSFVVVDEQEVVAPFGCETIDIPSLPADGRCFSMAAPSSSGGALFDSAPGVRGGLFGAAEVCADLFCEDAPPPVGRGLLTSKPTLGLRKGLHKPMLVRKPALGTRAKVNDPFPKFERALDRFLAGQMDRHGLADLLEALLDRLGNSKMGRWGRSLVRRLRAGDQEADSELGRWYRKLKLLRATEGANRTSSR